MRSYFLLFAFILAGCKNSGTLTINGRNSAQGGGGSANLVGSCSLLADPLVLMEGYCVEAHGSSLMKSACILAGGNYADMTPCALAPNTVGRCTLHLASGFLTVYFANTTLGPARCAEALGTFENGSDF